MNLQIRPSDDVLRLFSALGESDKPASDLSVHDLDDLSLASTVGALDDIDPNSVALSLLVAMATGWVAIRAYERNKSISWGLAWAAFGYLWPIPAVALSYYRDVADA